LACEHMNEYARLLRGSSEFESVRTGADIRYYESGWRLEKWIEAELDKDEGLWAAWWLEFGAHEDGWIIESHLAISPDVFFAGLEDQIVTSNQEIGGQLELVVDDLKNALVKNQQFADEVRKRRTKK